MKSFVLSISRLVVLLQGLLVCTAVSAQNRTVTVDRQDVPVKTVMADIENQTDYSFFYNEGLTVLDFTVSVSMKDAPVGSVLRKIFTGTGISWKIEGNEIVLTAADGQDITISGKVTDAASEPLIGVNVYPKGQVSEGVITDIDGNYEISVGNPDEPLCFSYIGFETLEVVPGKRSKLDVVMHESAIMLDEVVAIGYGVSKRSTVTGSISSVKAEDLPKAANASVNNMLSGRASGVQVSQTSAQPGGGVSVIIRGAGSDQAGNQPLYVIDGFPINNSSVDPGDGDYSVGSRDPLSTINPNDIESIEILKDAASTAIYGARAANGVILITTKRGAEGKTKVNLSYTGSVQRIDRYFDMLNAKEFMQYSNILGKEQYLISNNQYPYGPKDQDFTYYTPKYTAREIAAAGEGTDWWDEVTRMGVVHDANLSVSGGNSKTTFLVSGSFFDQKGLVVNSTFRRISGRVNLDHKIFENLKIGVSATGSYVDNGNVQLGEGQWETSGVLVAALQMSPVAPIYDETGDYYINPMDATLPNPVSFREIDDMTVQKRLLANAYVEYTPVKGLTLRVNTGIDSKSGERSSYTPTSFLYGASYSGKAVKALNNSNDVLFNATASYNATFGEAHNFGAMIGYEYQKFMYDGFSAQANDFFTDAFGSNNLGAAEGTPTVGSYRNATELASYFTRLTYDYKEKYLVSFTLRRDGSSNFGAGNKWGLFPSVAVAWRITQEKFMDKVRFISMLKLRASFGQTGNSGIGDKAFAYYGITEFPYMFGDNIVMPATKIQLANPNLKWETTTEVNVGLDFGIINNRITGTLEYYNKVVSDLLSSRTLPAFSEIRTVADNIGATQLSGIEFEVHSVNIDGVFRWTTDLNISSYYDRWKERNPDVVLQPWEGEHDRIRAIYGYKTAGIVQVGQDVPWMESELPGNLIYQDINGFDENHQLTGEPDGKISDADITYLGSSDPAFSYGFGNTFEFKGFDLNIFFYGMAGKYMMNANKDKYMLSASRLPEAENNMMTDVDKLFLSTKPSTTTPGIANHPYQGYSDYLIENASFLRLKNVTLGYTIPQKVLKYKANIRVFFDAQNLWLLTGYTGIDPEFDSLGAYPNAKTFSFGVNLTF